MSLLACWFCLSLILLDRPCAAGETEVLAALEKLREASRMQTDYINYSNALLQCKTELSNMEKEENIHTPYIQHPFFDNAWMSYLNYELARRYWDLMLSGSAQAEVYGKERANLFKRASEALDRAHQAAKK